MEKLQIEEGVKIANRTSYKIGGVADYFSKPKNTDELKEVVAWAKRENVEIFTLGRGTNILLSDSGFSGLIIDTSNINFIRWNENEVVTGTGQLLHTLVMDLVNNGFCGFENLAGIPGSVGGGVIMNAGAFGTEISENIISVSALNLDTLKTELFLSENLEFGYRTSFFKNKNYIITEIKFRFKKSEDIDTTQKKVADILKRRKVKQPINLPNCGSVFKRPKGNYAGTLIEECGLKGFRVGGAMVSEKHANFIVNIDNATANDVRAVVVAVQKKVYLKRGIKLDPELIFVGNYKEELL